MSGLVHLFSRLCVGVPRQTTRSISTTSPVYVSTTSCLFAQPLKKKKRMDPAILRARDERRKRKIEKQIKRMEKFGQPQKPIEELQLPLTMMDQREMRKRPKAVLSQEEEEQRVLLIKAWSAYRMEQHMADVQMLDRIVFSQQRALDALRLESEELYQAAIEVDMSLIPTKCKGPSLTPPAQKYESPDGDYIDVSVKWN